MLDEPFSGLDPIAMGNMSELLGEVAAAGTTVLFSSHQLDLVEDLCEDVVIIDHGRIVLAGDLDELRAAVPQRFVDVRYRGVSPDWSALSSVELVGSKDGEARLRVDRDAALAAVAIARSSPDIVSFAYQPPTLSGCSAGRWQHERPAAGLAGRPAGGARAEPLARLPRRAGGHAPRRRGRDRRASDAGQRSGCQGCRGDRGHPRRAARPSPVKATPSAWRCGCTASTTWPPGEEAVRQQDVDVLVVDARQLEWRGQADEQLRAVVTGAIQLVAVRTGRRGRCQSRRPPRLGEPRTRRERRARRGRGRSPNDELAAIVMTVLLLMAITTYGNLVLTGVVEEKASRVVEVLLARMPARTCWPARSLALDCSGSPSSP